MSCAIPAKAEFQFDKVMQFLRKDDFNGFTKDDLFILQMINKPWGQDIAALSNMAEALAHSSLLDRAYLLRQVVERAIDKKVNPYKKELGRVKSLGKFNYYLEHLNIILGHYQAIVDGRYKTLNQRISEHLLQASYQHKHFHADLLPHIKMKWSADQAAIIHSLWLYDQNNGTALHDQLAKEWLDRMHRDGTHKETGLFTTEATGRKVYSHQPRGCSQSYMIHYMYSFAKDEALRQWDLYKQHMLIKGIWGYGFREYLPDFNGKWTPDSGPVINGIGISATGLGLKAAATVGDKEMFDKLHKLMKPTISFVNATDGIYGLNRLTRIGSDLLASSIILNAFMKMEG